MFSTSKSAKSSQPPSSPLPELPNIESTAALSSRPSCRRPETEAAEIHTSGQRTRFPNSKKWSRQASTAQLKSESNSIFQQPKTSPPTHLFYKPSPPEKSHAATQSSLLARHFRFLSNARSSK